MTSESDGKISCARAQQLIDESNERLCFIPAKSENSHGNSFSTLVLDGTLRDFVVCNQCSKAIPWKIHSDTDTIIHHCDPCESAHRTCVPEFIVKVSPRSSPEKENQEDDKRSHVSGLNAQEITDLIENSSDRIRLLPKKGKSLVWKLFSLVEVDGIRQDYVFCNQCNIVTRWKPKDGTNNLRIHVCKRHTMPSDISITELLSEPSGVDSCEIDDQNEARQSSSSRQVSKRELQVLIDSCSTRVSLIPGRGKSQVWMRFYLVKIDREMTNFAMCKECKAAVIWKSKDGTTGLRKHVCKIERTAKKRKLTSECPQTSSSDGYPRIEYEDHGDVSLLTKEEVQSLIDKSSERVCLIPGRGKSDVWMTFSFVEVDGRKMELALCNLCNSVVTWKSKDGTNGLRKHSCKQIRLSQPPENPPQSPFRTSLPVTYTELEERVAVMCGMDIVPIDLISCPGFINLIQYVYNLGANSGVALNVKEFMPTEKSVARRVDEIAMMEKENIITELQACTSVGVGFDIWNHSLTSKDFLTISIHYMLETEDSLVVRNRVIHTCEIESKMEEFLREKSMFVLKEFGVQRKNVYVIGNENIIAQAFIKEKRIQCAGSGINSTLRAVFNDLSSEEYPQLVNLLQSCRKLVASVRSTRTHKKLLEDELSLQSEHPRCWNTTFNMLHSILIAMSKLEDVLSDSDEVSPFYHIDRTLLIEVVKLLKPFDEATKLLTWSNTPTLPLVVPTKVKLQRCLEAKEEDSEIIKELKKRLLQSLDDEFHINVVHCVATVLHPKMKGFVRQYLGEKSFEGTKEQITHILNKINGPMRTKDPEHQTGKKLQLEEDQSEFLSEVMSDYVGAESDDDDEQGELSFYLNSKYSTRFGDPLNYWKQNASLCPNLFRVATSVLAIPASGASCEMYATETGRKMDARRNCFSGDLINNILFIHSAMKS